MSQFSVLMEQSPHTTAKNFFVFTFKTEAEKQNPRG